MADSGLNNLLQPLLKNFTYVDENLDLAAIRWDLVGARGQTLVCQPLNKPTMPPASEEHHDAHNLPVRSPLKPTRGGMVSGGFGATNRTSSTLSSTSLGYHLPDTGFFKRSFDPTPRNGQSSLNGGWGTPGQQFDSRPQVQRPMMAGGLVQTRLWQPSASHSASGAFRLDEQGSSSYRDPGTPQHAKTDVQQANSSLSVVPNPVTPNTFYGQNEVSGSGSRSLVQSRSGSDAPSPVSSSTPRHDRPPKRSSFVIEIPSLASKKQGRPFANQQKTPSTDPNYKKRGRPFATAESAAKAAAKAAAAGSDSADGITKKRGRPFKIRTQLDIPVPEPVFIPFICEWKGCPAELHNLETLVAHVLNVHNKKQTSGSRLCLWGKCGVKHGPSDETTDSQNHDEPNEFKTKAEWKDHINQRHLIPFAWHMGDGPKGTSLCMF